MSGTPLPGNPVWLRIAVLLLLALPTLKAQGSISSSGQSEDRYVGLVLGTIRSESWMGASSPKAPFTTSTFSAFAGAKGGRHWGVEISLDGYGKFPTSDGSSTWRRDVVSLTVSGLVRLPLTGSLSAYGRAGWTYWSASQGSRDPVLAPGEHAGDGTTPQVGLGLSLDLGRQWSLRAEGSVLAKVLNARVTRLGGGLAYHF